MKQKYLIYLVWVVCSTIWVTLCFILPDFINTPANDLRTIFTIAIYLCALGGASFWIIYLVGIYRFITWLGLPLLGIGGAIVSYYRVAFHATITPMIIDATLHTNGGTIASVISWQLIGWILTNFFIALGFIIWRNKIGKLRYNWIQVFVILCLWMVYYFSNGRLHRSINQRYPFNVAHSVVEYSKQQHKANRERAVLEYKVQNMPDSLDIIFVLGEAVRADHLQLNGYARETNPLLISRKNIISFPNIYSEHTYTSTSVPLILSPADSLNPERCKTHCSFIRTIKECGFNSAWISNQDYGHTYFEFIHEANTIIFPNASKSVFVFNPWYDEQLLPPIDTLMNKSLCRNLYVLHMIGSHWYYNIHVPEKYQIFTPTTTNRIVTDNSDKQICNSYDNTIRYLDVILDSLIQRFEKRNSILIYLSDHGEALGEEGIYLHAAETDALHNPACVIWYSDKYAQLYPEKIKALIANKDKRYRTDFLYHSILSATGIETEENNSMDIFTLDTTYVK